MGPGPNRTVRETTSLGLSVAIHLLVAAALSVSWMAAEPAPPPEHVEMTLVTLPPPPAPEEGQPAPAPALAPRPPLQAAPPTAARSAALARPRGPTVEYRVRVADARCPQPATDDQPRAPLVPDDAVALWQPAERALPALAAQALPGRGAPAPAGLAASALAVPEPVFHLHDHGEPDLAEPAHALPPADLEHIGGATGPLLAIIQARIDRVIPLVHRTTPDCRSRHGLARIRLLLNKRGYPLGYQLLESTGSACLDEQINAVLHLAEPYPYVAGWIPARLRFTL